MIKNRENRAYDKELEEYDNVGVIDIEEFSFARGKKGTEKFRIICEAISKNPDVKTITFQNGTRDDGLTFDQFTKEQLLFKDDNLSVLSMTWVVSPNLIIYFLVFMTT